MISLSHLLTDERAPDHPTVIVDGQVISWQEWRHQVLHWSCVYRAQSAQRYCLWEPNAYRFSVQLYALWLAGKTAVLPPNNQPETLQRLRSEFDALAHNNENDGELSLIQKEMTTSSVIDDQYSALVLYTSGSSGEPKSTTRSLKNLQCELTALHQQFAPSHALTVVGAVPHYHIYGLLFRVLWPLIEAWPFVAEAAEYPEPMLALLTRHQPSLLIASPAQLTRFPDHFDWRLFSQSTLHCFSSGAPLPLEAAVLMHKQAGFAPIEVLGSTETGGVAWRQRQSEDCLWNVFANVETRLSENGLLEVKSDASSVAGWFEMGDRAELVNRCQLKLLGRADRIVKVEGKRLSLTEMEQCLAASEMVAHAAATLCYHNRDLVAVVAVLSPQGQQHLETHGRKSLVTALRTVLSHRFERVLWPRWFRFVEALPIDARGKTTQAALQQLFNTKEFE